MGVKAPAVRRTDSLYAQLGGKISLAAIVDRFYEKMLADPDIRPMLAKANLASLKQQQTLFLTYALGGPADTRNRVTAPAHAHLLQPRYTERATTHLALVLSEMNMVPEVVDAVMERVTLEPDRDADNADDGESVGENDSRQEELLGALAAV